MKKSTKQTTKHTTKHTPPVLATPDAPPSDPVPRAVEPWPSAEYRREVIHMLSTIAAMDGGSRLIRTDYVRNLVHVSMTNGPAVVCTRAEWTEAHSEGCKRFAGLVVAWGADKMQTPRALDEDDLDELVEHAVPHTLNVHHIVADFIGPTYADRPGKILVRGRRTDLDGGSTLYLVEDLGAGALRVNIIGRQIGPLVVPNLQTSDVYEEGEPCPAYDSEVA